MLKDIKTIFFDYDGTIHESIKIYATAFRKGYQYLVDNKYAEDRQWTDDEVSYWLGYSSKDMWRQFMPELDEDIRNQASKCVGQEMLNQLSQGNAALYDGAIETLEYLKNKGYKLVFLSNCGIKYRNMNRDTFNLDQYFDNLVCSEEHKYIPKHQILSDIKDKYQEKMVMIGDRIHDMEAGIKNNIVTIGCKYGYGHEEEFKNADYVIENIKELKNLL